MNDFVRVPESDWQGIVDATREKTGGTEKLLSGEVAAAVRGISTGTPVNNQDKTVTQNGTYTADEGYTGLGTVSVNVTSSGGSEIEEQFIRAIERVESKPLTKIPAGLTVIGQYAFCKCTNLALTELPAGLTSIGQCAFQGCTNLALTELPAGLTVIDHYAFDKCTNLALTELPAGLTHINSYAFRSCTNLALTELPAGLTVIGQYAFYGCTKITEITFKGTPGSIPSNSFSNCTNLITVNVPWAEGEVANAPWGATNATINYNYTGG